MNIYAPNVGADKHINQLITKVKTYLDNNTLTLGDLNTVLSANERSKHNISKETRALNDTLHHMGFTDIYRTLHLKATEYTVFSWNFLRIVHQIPKHWNCPLHIFRPQCFETRTQSQEEIWKKLKHMEEKGHPAER